jgi:hypothetical protein
VPYGGFALSTRPSRSCDDAAAHPLAVRISSDAVLVIISRSWGVLAGIVGWLIARVSADPVGRSRWALVVLLADG